MFITPTVYRRLINLYMALVSVLTLAFVLLFPHTSRNWVISDWLINYEGGFVRRGLAGEVAFRLAHLLHISPFIFPILDCLILYSVLLFCVRLLALRTEPSWWTLVLLTSPATFAFQIMDIGGGGRKELIFLAGLALLLVVLQRTRISGVAAGVYLSLVIVVGVLSHELMIFYTPYFLAVLMVAGRSVGQAIKQCAVPFVLGAVATLACAAHPGNFATASAICGSLGDHLSTVGKTNTVCGGGSAMAYLTITRDGAVEDARKTATDDHYFVVYPLLSILAFLPAIAGSRRLLRTNARGDVLALWWIALLSFACSLVLFVVALDWGRWIYIHIITITMILFFLADRKRQAAEASVPSGFRLHPIGALLIVLNAVLWTLPHAGRTPLFGYIDVVRDLRVRMHRHESSVTPLLPQKGPAQYLAAISPVRPVC